MNRARLKAQLKTRLFWLKAAAHAGVGGGLCAIASYLQDPNTAAEGPRIRKLAASFFTGAGVAIIHWLYPSPFAPTVPPPAQ